MGLSEDLHNLTVQKLKEEVAKTNIKGYIKMKKDELVKLIIKNEEKFKKLISKSKPKAAEVKPKAEEKPKAAMPKAEEAKAEEFNPKDLKTNKNSGTRFIRYLKNNVGIKMEIEEASDELYLDHFEAQADKKKDRAPKGVATKTLCNIVKEMIKKKWISEKTKFTLQAGKLKTDTFDKGKLNAFYKKMGFEDKGEKRGMTQFEQTVGNFLKHCDK